MAIIKRGLAILVVVLSIGGERCGVVGFDANYKEALQKSILFFEGQRSGKLPPDQRMRWRKDSALDDGRSIGVDLVGGYYDAGDNVKFGFPMAFTTTVLSWAIIEFGENMGGEVVNAHATVRWATDYLLKATSEDNKVYVQVGDPYADHDCWERPEDMDTVRSVYAITPQSPGSEVAAETAAALAAASLVFKGHDPAYAATLLSRAISVFAFADKYRGSYSESLGKWVCPFYCDFSGYMDELLWAATWLHYATDDQKYWQYVENNIGSITGFSGEFGWDDKHAGIYILLSEKLMGQPHPENQIIFMVERSQDFACVVLPESPSKGVDYSPGGLMFKEGGSNLQHSTGLSFLLLVYAKYLKLHGKTINCGNIANIPPSRLIQVVKSQVDYILGNNPLGMSYMVGYGNKFPQRIHHRGSALPSVDAHPDRIMCHGGDSYFRSPQPNPNVLVGAIVGGPTMADNYPDSRVLFNESEPTTYLNAPMVGLLAYFTSPN